MLQFQRFRVFHPLPKQAHHGILKTLWDKRVQWNQGLNARRTKQLLQAFLDQDVRLGVPSQALPLPATAPRPAVTAASAAATSAATVPVAAPTPAAMDIAAVPRAAAAAASTNAASPAKAVASPVHSTALPAAVAPAAQNTAEALAHTHVQTHVGGESPAKGLAGSPARAGPGQSKGSARTQPWIRPKHKKPLTDRQTDAAGVVASPSVHDPLQGNTEQGSLETAPASLVTTQEQSGAAPVESQAESAALSQPTSPDQHSDSAEFDSSTPATTSSQSDATNFESLDVSQAGGVEGSPGEGLGAMADDVLPSLPPLHLSKAQHRCSLLLSFSCIACLSKT